MKEASPNEEQGPGHALVQWGCAKRAGYHQDSTTLSLDNYIGIMFYVYQKEEWF